MHLIRFYILLRKLVLRDDFELLTVDSRKSGSRPNQVEAALEPFSFCKDSCPNFLKIILVSIKVLRL